MNASHLVYVASRFGLFECLHQITEPVVKKIFQSHRQAYHCSVNASPLQLLGTETIVGGCYWLCGQALHPTQTGSNSEEFQPVHNFCGSIAGTANLDC